MKRALPVIAACLGMVIPALAQDYPNSDRSYHDSRDRDRASNYPDTIPAGTKIRVRADNTIDVRDRADNRIYRGTVADDVTGENGNVLIPRGANAELIVTNTGEHDMSVDLESVTVNGRRYMVSAAAYDRARNEGVGENNRTAKYVGGGALLGTIIGAIAGGGKGAAIGAIAGAGAGAGTQVLTRGNAIRIPAETVLTFRLDQPLDLGRGSYSRDNGYDRNGYHYHDDYYHRDQNNQYPPPR
jgi:hypothetical protein